MALRQQTAGHRSGDEDGWPLTPPLILRAPFKMFLRALRWAILIPAVLIAFAWGTRRSKICLSAQAKEIWRRFVPDTQFINRDRIALPIKIKNRHSLTRIQWADSISFHDSTASDADVFEQLMLFVRLVRHIWRVMIKQ